MTTLFRKTVAMLVFIAIGATFATAASAQCASLQPLPARMLMQKQSWHGQGGLMPVAFIRVAADEEREAGIVGFWRVVFTAKGSAGIPDGTVIDKGFQQWHSDGTEILNSSKPPVTGNFCLGVWKKIGPSKYTLNHFGIGADTFSNFSGLANIREEVVLRQDGAEFYGTFTIVQYDPNGNNPVTVKGVINGQRIGVRTAVGDLI